MNGFSIACCHELHLDPESKALDICAARLIVFRYTTDHFACHRLSSQMCIIHICSEVVQSQWHQQPSKLGFLFSAKAFRASSRSFV